jgi:hypothetical protein
LLSDFAVKEESKSKRKDANKIKRKVRKGKINFIFVR